MPDSRAVAPTVTTIHLVYLARLREAFGRGQEDLVLAESAPSVGEVLASLRARGGIWAEELHAARAVRVALNHAVVDDAAPLRDGDEVALLPPVTGG